MHSFEINLISYVWISTSLYTFFFNQQFIRLSALSLIPSCSLSTHLKLYHFFESKDRIFCHNLRLKKWIMTIVLAGIVNASNFSKHWNACVNVVFSSLRRFLSTFSTLLSLFFCSNVPYQFRFFLLPENDFSFLLFLLLRDSMFLFCFFFLLLLLSEIKWTKIFSLKNVQLLNEKSD